MYGDYVFMKEAIYKGEKPYKKLWLPKHSLSTSNPQPHNSCENRELHAHITQFLWTGSSMHSVKLQFKLLPPISLQIHACGPTDSSQLTPRSCCRQRRPLTLKPGQSPSPQAEDRMKTREKNYNCISKALVPKERGFRSTCLNFKSTESKYNIGAIITICGNFKKN